MHITRLEVRHWRRHDHLLIDGLSERITLVSGPNEAGKSTLAEALRFALFEPSKPVYDARKALQQRGGGEPPEVEVDLDVDGQRWRIAKRFLRRQQTRLSGPGGRTLEGEEAERRLQELLRTSVPEVGRATRDVDARHLGLWPVLWQAQGRLAGLDDAVTEGVRGRLSELVAREVGAVAAGPLGQRALELSRAEYDRHWTVTARPTGDHARALKERDEAQARLAAAEDVLRGFEEAAQRLHALVARLAALGPRWRQAEDLAAAAQQRARLSEERQRDLERQRRLVDDQRRAAGEAQAQLARRADLDGRLAHLRGDLAKVKAAAAALAGERERAEREQLHRDGEAQAARQRASAARDAVERAERAAERAALIQRATEGATQVARAERLAKECAQAQARADALRAPTPRTIAALRELEARWRDTCAKRDAAATSLVFQAERAITARWTADGRAEAAELPAGGSFTGSTSGLGELHLPGVGTVRVRAGAGDAASLATAAQAAGAKLEEALRAAGASSPDAAQAQAEERQAATAEARRAGTALAAALGLEADAGGEACAAALARQQRASAAEQVRLAASAEPGEGAADPETARSLARSAAADEEAASADREANASLLKRLSDELHTADTAVAVCAERAEAVKGQLDQLPEPAALVLAQVETTARLGEAVNRAEEISAAWEALGGASAAEEAADLARAARRLQEETATARADRDALQAGMRATTARDPAAAVQEAAAEVTRAVERAAHIQRQAEAARTLRETLLAAQRETRAALAGPVRAAIEPYLGRIFPRAKLLMGDDDWLFSGWSAGDGAEPFEQLSLGAREQFALLVRLGLAEVLAQGNRLPLVLDDPLVNADPERRRTLLQALRHASRKLQIILFTCHEAEHDGLAAETVVALPGGRG